MKQKIDLSSIENKIPEVAFELFRYWTKAYGIDKKIEIKSEQVLVSDLKETIKSALESLNKKEDLSEKPKNWDVGYIIGFINGNLGKHWRHEYITKNSKDYKLFLGLKAINLYLKNDDLTTIKINKFYDILLNEDSNLNNLESEIQYTDLDFDKFEITEKNKSGRVLTVLNNLIMEYVKNLSELDNKVSLPVDDNFSKSEIKQLILDNPPYRNICK